LAGEAIKRRLFDVEMTVGPESQIVKVRSTSYIMFITVD
jgi:hypothetical protein